MSTVSAFQGMDDALRVGYYLAEVLPDEVIKLLRRAEAGWTLFRLPAVNGIAFSRTNVVGLAALQFAGQARGLALPTTDQGAQQVGMGFIVALGEALVLRQFRFSQVKLFLTNQGRDAAHQDPLLRRQFRQALVRPADGMRGRAAYTGWPVAVAAGIDLAQVSWLAKDGT